MAAAAGAVLYLPFFIWFRVRARKSKSSGAHSVRYTAVAWCLMGVMLTVLFCGLAMGKLAPTSWLGAQVGTLFGGIGYFFVVSITFALMELGFPKLGVPFVRQAPVKDDETLIPTSAPHDHTN